MAATLADPWWTVVMVAGGRRFTCTLDASDKAERYLSATGETVRESALGRLSAAEGGVRLTPLGSSTLLLEDGSEAEELLLSAGSATATATLTDARTGEACIVYLRSCDPGARRFHKMALTGDCELLIGGDEGCQLRYASRWVSQRHTELRCRSGVFAVRDLGSTNGTFVNGALLAGGASRQLAPGDVVQVLDLCVQVGRGFLSLNAPQGLTEALGGLAVPIRHAELVRRAPEATPADRIPAQREFWPAPRVVRSVQRRAYNVEEPPAVHKPDDSPAIMKMGPSFLMGLASIFMAASAVSRIMGGADVLSSAPSIAMCVSMMGGMVLWPLIARRYERRKAVREEAHRRSAYSDYLAALERTFIKDGREQSAILRENRVDARTCLGWVHGRDERLMGRGPRDADFMQLRVGTGTLPLEADFRWPETRFSLDADDLVEMARRLSDRPPMLEDVPVAVDLLEDRTLGVAGDPASRWALARSLVLQVAALYAPTDVRIAAIVGEGERDEWGFLAQLPHTLSADGRMRLVATDAAGVRELGALLAREAAGRRGGAEGGRCLLLCSDRGLWEASDVVADLLEAEKDLGVSLVFLAPDVAGLPSETVRVAEVGPREGRLYAREDASSTLVDLVMDAPVAPAEAARAASALARVGLGAGDAAFALPSSLGFLEMYGVRDAADLSVGARWERADASRSLAAPFGVDARGMPAVLDPHEAFDGPHGLVAGTTGSGKSELLVSWILSTCVAFPPEQASFVLVDYKGGGLADAFSRGGMKLPHLAGTVTNLDGAEVARSLASIRAELVRRQRMLAGAKRATGDATMDVSSYQRHWAAGDVAEPMPHLFVVADEFAELKQQEPEFLDALVSAARIGRSLGVHLVLATQRPTGVVTDQIQANSRFRVCLRVADAADSKEMVRRPDAAALEGAGRLILLVGYDERLLQAQAAWAGGPYDPAGAGGDRAVEAAGSPGAPVAAL
ncbi:FtsK/SpoIIIE domain-containing protein, partial [Olsenella profusa]|uniref:FtsK/SpoIIIE domain-containing protein n=1 Tax=Olsenella profusa TaxID=138595 RepID=UPI0012EB9BA8